MVIGIAGNIGAGKTTVSKIFAEHGARVISADELGWEIIKKGTKEFEELVREFGPAILHSDGAIDRKKLGSIVFADPAKRQRLNRIVHPRLVARLTEEIHKTKSDELLVIDAALIFDWGLEQELDLVIVVTAPAPVKIARLTAQGQSETEARHRLQSQIPELVLAQRAHVVIDNSGTIDELRTRTLDVIDSILKD
jgi:dephospho-CoA kinase